MTLADPLSFNPSEVRAYYAARIPQLRKQGHEYRCACPIHGGKRPDSFTVDLETGRWHCHSDCGRGGHLYEFEELTQGGGTFLEIKKRIYDAIGKAAELPQKKRPRAIDTGKPVKIYPYQRADSSIVFEVCRYEYRHDGELYKTFKVRRPLGPDSYDWHWPPPADLVLYRLPQVAKAKVVLLAEGEKCVELLESRGFVATTSAGGAEQPWHQQYTEQLAGKRVVIFYDVDPPNRKGKCPGWEWAHRAARALHAAGNSVKLLAAADGHQDVGDWVDAGATREAIIAHIEAAPQFTLDQPQPAPPPEPELSVTDRIDAQIEAAIGKHDIRAVYQLASAVADVDDQVWKAGLVAKLRLAFPDEFRASDWRDILKQAGLAKRRAASAEARRPSRPTEGPRADWKSLLLTSSAGNTLPNLANAITALGCSPEWHGVLAFDEFRNTVITRRETPWGDPAGRWDDESDRLACRWLQQQGIGVKTNVAGEAVQSVARSSRIHPVREYLDGLIWDGESRIHTWLTDYLAAAPGNYTAAVGAKWLVAGVARILQPGSKVDSMLVLEGAQGAGKSSALAVMARRGEWFTDDLAEVGSKDAAMQLAGRWIVEIGELAAMHRAAVERVKAFLSRQTDKFRMPYGKHIESIHRQCIFAGSTNAEQYLVDETGNRRFWPVKCGTIDVEGLERVADQLWAEAVVLYQEGAQWWLTGTAAQEAADLVASRLSGDPWGDLVDDYLHQTFADSVTVSHLLEQTIKRPKEQWTQMDHNRVARILRTMGWQRYKARVDGHGGPRQWRYRRPD